VVIRGNCRRFVEVEDLPRGFAGLLTVIVGCRRRVTATNL
jgi:hypothetical protein